VQHGADGCRLHHDRLFPLLRLQVNYGIGGVWVVSCGEHIRCQHVLVNASPNDAGPSNVNSMSTATLAYSSAYASTLSTLPLMNAFTISTISVAVRDCCTAVRKGLASALLRSGKCS
jgi:hypothetical protein